MPRSSCSVWFAAKQLLEIGFSVQGQTATRTVQVELNKLRREPCAFEQLLKSVENLCDFTNLVLFRFDGGSTVSWVSSSSQRRMELSVLS